MCCNWQYFTKPGNVKLGPVGLWCTHVVGGGTGTLPWKAAWHCFKIGHVYTLDPLVSLLCVEPRQILQILKMHRKEGLSIMATHETLILLYRLSPRLRHLLVLFLIE
jgi:hypothetical protein